MPIIVSAGKTLSIGISDTYFLGEWMRWVGGCPETSHLAGSSYSSQPNFKAERP